MLAIVAPATALALASLGGGLYEFSVVDPFWPKRPDLVQPARAWTRRSRLRLPLDLVTCGALLTAFAAAARLG